MTPTAWMVDRMIRRNVRRRFRNAYWQAPEVSVPQPAIFAANHHGWHDGYLMYLALSRLDLAGIHDWIEEFDAFPLFGAIGGLPFPAGDPATRALTIRRTVRFLRAGHSLLIFPEGALHRPPELMPFGRSLDFLVSRAPGATVIPVAIRYEQALHERPEAFISFGPAVEPGPELARRTRLAVAAQLDRLSARMASCPDSLAVLHAGSKDVNERMDMRKMPAFRSRHGNRTDQPPRNEN